MPETNTSCIVYVTKRGQACAHDIENGIIQSKVKLGIPVASTPTFIPPKGKQKETRIAIISKDSDAENIMKISFVKLLNGFNRKIEMTLQSKDVVKLTFHNKSAVLGNILYDGEHVIFGRRDDRIYFIKSLLWET